MESKWKASAQLQATIEENQRLKKEGKQLRKNLRSVKYRLKEIAANVPLKGA